MRPAQHPSNNDVLHPPPGVPLEECQPLAITRAVAPDGSRLVFSYWELSDAERAAIAAGAKVAFSCWGTTHPPVCIAVDGVTGPVW